MTKKEMCIDRALHERLLAYKALSAAFSYPKKEGLKIEYDRLFRSNEIWLYGAEYLAENEFQRAHMLSDIMGFYKAFGLDIENNRPDSLEAELEFMHYLIFKEINAPDTEKASICRDAQNKFFNEHLYPAGKKIAERIIPLSKNKFYTNAGRKLSGFLESEKKGLNEKD